MRSLYVVTPVRSAIHVGRPFASLGRPQIWRRREITVTRNSQRDVGQPSLRVCRAVFSAVHLRAGAVPLPYAPVCFGQVACDRYGDRRALSIDE